MIYEESFGVIPLKKTKDNWFTYLIKNKSGNHWGFPKGHAKISETKEGAALRELKEETNLTFVKFLYKLPLIEQYTFFRNSDRVIKKVYYYLVEVKGEAKVTSKEILEGKWVEVKNAKTLVTHKESQAIADQVEVIIQRI